MKAGFPTDVIDVLRQEFKELNYVGKTKWLSKVFNGLQTSLVEVYIIDKFIQPLISPEEGYRN